MVQLLRLLQRRMSLAPLTLTVPAGLPLQNDKVTAFTAENSNKYMYLNH